MTLIESIVKFYSNVFHEVFCVCVCLLQTQADFVDK